MIPRAFEQDIRALLGGEAEAFLAAMREEPMRGIRLTPGKASPCRPVRARPSPGFPACTT